MKNCVFQSLGLLLCCAVSGPVRADSEIDVKMGDLRQTTTGSHSVSEINIGSSGSDHSGGLRVHVEVGDVAALASGSGNKSTINIGSIEGQYASEFKARVVIGGKVVLDTDDSHGEINIASQTSK